MSFEFETIVKSYLFFKYYIRHLQTFITLSCHTGKIVFAIFRDENGSRTTRTPQCNG